MVVITNLLNWVSLGAPLTDGITVKCKGDLSVLTTISYRENAMTFTSAAMSDLFTLCHSILFWNCLFFTLC